MRVGIYIYIKHIIHLNWILSKQVDSLSCLSRPLIYQIMMIMFRPLLRILHLKDVSVKLEQNPLDLKDAQTSNMATLRPVPGTKSSTFSGAHM